MADLRRDSGLDQKVLDAVGARTPGAKDIAIVNIQDSFLSGKLYTISFSHLENGQANTFENKVYVTKNKIKVFGRDSDLLAVVGETHSRSFYDVFANGDVVSGMIAILVTILIVPSFFMSYYTGKEVSAPEWITSGWLLILGFYFGKASSGNEAK